MFIKIRNIWGSIIIFWFEGVIVVLIVIMLCFLLWCLEFLWFLMFIVMDENKVEKGKK